MFPNMQGEMHLTSLTPKNEMQRQQTWLELTSRKSLGVVAPFDVVAQGTIHPSCVEHQCKRKPVGIRIGHASRCMVQWNERRVLYIPMDLRRFHLLWYFPRPRSDSTPYRSNGLVYSPRKRYSSASPTFHDFYGTCSDRDLVSSVTIFSFFLGCRDSWSTALFILSWCLVDLAQMRYAIAGFVTSTCHGWPSCAPLRPALRRRTRAFHFFGDKMTKCKVLGRVTMGVTKCRSSVDFVIATICFGYCVRNKKLGVRAPESQD